MTAPFIEFHKEQITYRIQNIHKIRSLIKKLIKNERGKLKGLNIILCNNRYLRKLNKQYLNKNYDTDIITFDNSEAKNEIEGDIFINIEVIKENANTYDVPVRSELNRVIIHGTLHLLGYKDDNARNSLNIRKKEDYYLNLYK